MPLTPPIVATATLGRQDGTPLWEERMTRIIDFYFFALKVAIALLLAGMVVLVFGNVVLRYAFNQGITVSEELSRIFFVWVTFLGAVVAMREHGHLGVDTVIKRLPPLAARIAVLSGYALMLFATWLMISGSWAQTLINLHVGAPATGLSMGFFYGAGLAFGVPAFLILLADAFAIATGRIDVTTAELVRDSEDEMALDDLPEPVLGPFPSSAEDLVMTVTIFLGALLGPMALGVPIAFALIISGVALMLYLGLFDAQIVAQNVLNGADSFPLMAVPFFLLAGEVMNTGGLSRRIVALAMAMVGHVRGGLGFVAIFAACILSSLSGSAVADAAALGRCFCR